MKPLELGRVKPAKRPSVLCSAVGSPGSLVPSGGRSLTRSMSASLTQTPGRPSYRSTCTSKPSKLSRTASVSVARSLGCARQPTVRRPPPWDSSSQGPRIHSNWPAAAQADQPAAPLEEAVLVEAGWPVDGDHVARPFQVELLPHVDHRLAQGDHGGEHAEAALAVLGRRVVQPGSEAQLIGDALFVVALAVVDDIVGVGGEAGAAEVEGVAKVVRAGRLALELAL